MNRIYAYPGLKDISSIFQRLPFLPEDADRYTMAREFAMRELFVFAGGGALIIFWVAAIGAVYAKVSSASCIPTAMLAKIGFSFHYGKKSSLHWKKKSLHRWEHRAKFKLSKKFSPSNFGVKDFNRCCRCSTSRRSNHVTSPTFSAWRRRRSLSRTLSSRRVENLARIPSSKTSIRTVRFSMTSQLVRVMHTRTTRRNKC